MTARTIAWVIVGVMVGMRAAVKARSTVAVLRRDGEIFGEAHLTDRAPIVPLAAATGGGLCALLPATYPGNITVLAHVVFVSTCLYLALVDIDTHVLPRRATYVALTLGLPLLALSSVVDDAGTFVGVLIGSFSTWIALRAFAVLSRGDLGGGDVTMGLLLGAYAGFGSAWNAAYALAAGFAVGGVFALAMLLVGRADRRTRFAFGPFLIVGALVVVVR